MLSRWTAGLVALLVLVGLCSAQVCVNNGPLGMITGKIQDWQITASSTYPQEWDKHCHEKYARIYLPNKLGWCAKYKSSSEWLQVDLGVAAKVTGLMTQGRGDGVEWVTAFMASYSMDAFNWQYVTDQYGNQRVFEGNVDSYGVKHSYLDSPIIARFIKFHTVHWHRHPSMRVEVFGCQLCKEPIGLPPYGKMTASSFSSRKRKRSCQPEDGNILSNKAWCSKKQDENQWIQVDVGPPTLITGILTKGREDTRRKHWVTRFKVSYSNDTRVWYFYKDANHLDAKEFGGNMDKHMERVHYLNSPFVARYVRFHPIEWHQKISMRVGLLGCPYTGHCGSGFMRVNDDTPCIENLAFKKESWINSRRHYKRHIRNRIVHGHASRAVDGDFNRNLNSCTILDNLYGDNPVWMVDLGRKAKIAGVMIHTWQGSGQEDVTKYKNYQSNLDKLVVYVDDKLKDEDDSYASGNMCGYVSRLNNALFLPRLHISCIRPMEGRYVLVEAWGVPNSWSRLFSAVLCEVQIYE
ncbi:lactadherin-like isoform X2 [Liolophura sinensis]|uniref:lactadherin-like isoform X2 n=1 Tax=Liolophura sinensis TaxID=3198878 RepID=UPI0031585133